MNMVVNRIISDFNLANKNITKVFGDLYQVKVSKFYFQLKLGKDIEFFYI